MLLYKLGWRGLNIDCDQEKIDLFNELRPRDTNICAAVANSNKKMMLLRYPMSATNRLSDKAENNQKSLCGKLPNNSISVFTKTLNEIIEECEIGNKKIDYLNVDVEGIELEVLEGLNFNKYAPTLISIEIIDSKNYSLIYEFLEKHGYTLSGIVRHNYFFKLRSCIPSNT